MVIYKEYETVEKPVIDLLTSLGWEYVPPEEMNKKRESYDEPFDLPALRKTIKNLNPDAVKTDEDVNLVISRLKKIPNDISGNKEFFEWLRGEKSISFKPGKKAQTIKLIDFENPENNTFVVTNQFEFEGYETIRPDVVVMVNGIPLAVIEAKRPVLGDKDPIEEGRKQLMRYYRDAPQLFKYLGFVGIADGLFFKYDWDGERFFDWKHPREEFEKDPFKTSITQIFNLSNFLDIIENFIVFHVTQNKITKKIAWYPQFRAVNAIVRRVVQEKKKKGLIWHFQGSGKTLTMLFAAWKLKKVPELENPTIILIVDRLELQRQLKDEFEKLPFTAIAKNRKDLEAKLKRDSREIIITTIQKFGKITEILNERENVIIFIDEAHRSQYGKLAARLRTAIPNAYIFGFTGTPIDKGPFGRNTFKVFCEEGERYLDKYSVKESIEDGATLPIYYQYRQVDYKLSKRIKELLDKEFLDITAGLSPEEQKKVLERSANLRNVLKAKDTVEKISKDIADHFQKYIEPNGVKAMVVAVDREGCVEFKEALDKLLPPEYSEIIFTPAQNDEPKLKKYHKSKDEQKTIIENFKDPEKLPKILIVTDMLLTGFDAPILQIMYLIKPLRDHTLLQAIARTNRPYFRDNFEKPFGWIADYVRIFDNLVKALNFDSTEIEGVAFDFEAVKKDFLATLNALLKMFQGIPMEGRESLLEALQVLKDAEKAKEFKKNFTKLKRLFNVLYPDPFVLKYEKEWKWLFEINIAYNRFYGREWDSLKEYTEKVKNLIRERLRVEKIEKELPIFKIDEQYLKKLERTGYPDGVKVIELKQALEYHIRLKIGTNPAYVKLSEKLERILKKKGKEEILRELQNLVKEVVEIEREAKRLGLTEEEYALLNVMKEYTDEKDEFLVEAVKELLDKIKETTEFKGWSKRKDLRIRVEEEIFKFCLSKFKGIVPKRKALEMSGRLLEYVIKYNP